MSFVQIQIKYGIPQKDFFAYLQVRHFIQANIKLSVDTMLPTLMEKFVINLNAKTLLSNNRVTIYRTVIDIILGRRLKDGRKIFNVTMIKKTGNVASAMLIHCF